MILPKSKLEKFERDILRGLWYWLLIHKAGRRRLEILLLLSLPKRKLKEMMPVLISKELKNEKRKIGFIWGKRGDPEAFKYEGAKIPFNRLQRLVNSLKKRELKGERVSDLENIFPLFSYRGKEL